MESFNEMFTIGGHSNSLGRSEEVLNTVLNNQDRLDELYECISHEDAWVRMRAIDTLEKVCRVHPDWLNIYTDKMLNVLTKSDQPSIQWHLAQIFSQIDLNKDQETKAIAWLKNLINTPNVDWIVSVNTMKSLLFFHKNGRVDTKELLELFKNQKNHKSKSVRKKAKELIEHELS